MREAVLDKVRLGCRIPVDAQLWHDMDVSIQQDVMSHMVDQIVFQFETTAFQEKLPPQTISKTVEFTQPVTVYMYAPTSPWQFFKQRHETGKWIGWFIRLFPKPEYEKLSHTKVARFSEEVSVDLHHSVIYPEAKAIASPHTGSVAIRWVETSWK